MGILKKNKRQLNKAEADQFFNQLMSQMATFSGGKLGLENKKAINKIFGRFGYYRSLVDKRGRDVAKIELELYDHSGEDKELVTESPLLDLLKKPNVEMTEKQFRKLLQIWYDDNGEWLLWKEKNVRGETVGLYPINPSRVIQKGSKDQKWQISYENGTKEIPHEDIIYCKDINPDDEYGRGAGQGQAMSDEVSTAEKITKMLEITFDNRAVPPYIITFDGMDEDSIQSARENWFNKFKGFLKANIPMFTNSKVDVKRLAYDFEETKVVEIMERMENMFRKMWGIPAELMGELGSSNRAASVEAWNIYSENVLIPNIDLFVDILNCYLVPEFGENLKLEYKNPNKADKKAQSDHMAKFPQNYTSNEVRRVYGHKDWEGEKGETIWTPLNFTSQYSPQGGNNQVFQDRSVPTEDVKEKRKVILPIKKKS